MKNALIDLLNIKDLDTISITHIAEKALIYRTTFYSHYPDKNFLLEEALAEVWKEEIKLKEFSQKFKIDKLNDEFWKGF